MRVPSFQRTEWLAQGWRKEVVYPVFVKPMNPTISPPCRYFPSNTTRLQYPITKTMKILKLKNKIKLNHLDGVSTFKRCFIRYWAPNKKFELDLCLIWEGMEEGYQTAYLPVQDLSHFKIGKLMIALMRMYNLLMHYV